MRIRQLVLPLQAFVPRLPSPAACCLTNASNQQKLMSRKPPSSALVQLMPLAERILLHPVRQPLLRPQDRRDVVIQPPVHREPHHLRPAVDLPDRPRVRAVRQHPVIGFSPVRRHIHTARVVAMPVRRRRHLHFIPAEKGPLPGQQLRRIRRERLLQRRRRIRLRRQRRNIARCFAGANVTQRRPRRTARSCAAASRARGRRFPRHPSPAGDGDTSSTGASRQSQVHRLVLADALQHRERERHALARLRIGQRMRARRLRERRARPPSPRRGLCRRISSPSSFRRRNSVSRWKFSHSATRPLREDAERLLRKREVALGGVDELERRAVAELHLRRHAVGKRRAPARRPDGLRGDAHRRRIEHDGTRNRGSGRPRRARARRSPRDSHTSDPAPADRRRRDTPASSAR